MLTPEFIDWLSDRVDLLEWSRINGANSITPEDIAYVTGQNKMVAILRAELEKQKHG